MATLGVGIIPQIDAFHKIKNNRKARQAKFENPKIISQRVSSKLEDIKTEGLKEIAIQMKLKIPKTKIKVRNQWIQIIDPKIRAINKIFHIAVGKNSLRLNKCISETKSVETRN